PGDASADTIVFDTSVFPPGSPATIALGATLPALDTGDDTVDGSAAGVIVEGGGTHLFFCFRLMSENNAIKGLVIHSCYFGVSVSADGRNNTIGGGNVIYGNGSGVVISGYGSSGNVVVGNYIGTDATGNTAMRNGVGVDIRFGSENIVGGSTEAERNVISGNAHSGVRIAFGDGNIVVGNYIGVGADGDAHVDNGVGVEITDHSENNTVGGIADGEGNRIAFNREEGVRVFRADSTGNTIRGNSIHSNDLKGIENEDGGNTELPPPVITGGGSVMGTACANCIIDIYSDDEDEGRVYEGSTTADGAGNWSFSGTPGGPNITATATDSDGNTSEFSASVAVSEVTPTPTTTPT
ncbi:MAG: right-handed parallel beta-helix repeat-containing protein, partial [Planctomycetes bacterium]|nr:right-handed parallel beta-helix repeat-containing protein [Planctomycetota bacterium]